MQDQKLIKEVIDNYFLGTYHGNEEQLRKAFHPNARITGLFKGEYCDWSLDEFIQRVTTTPTAALKNEPYEKKIIFLDQTVDAAMVRAHVLVAGIAFTDYITLLRIDGKWQIRNKSFTT